jgi:hypothetical protein
MNDSSRPRSIGLTVVSPAASARKLSRNICLVWYHAAAERDDGDGREVHLVGTLIVVTVLSYGFAAFALYVPLFKLGAAI